jgi:hypothetical protein
MSTPSSDPWERVAERMERAAARLAAVGDDLERWIANETAAVANDRRPPLTLIDGGKKGGSR